MQIYYYKPSNQHIQITLVRPCKKTINLRYINLHRKHATGNLIIIEISKYFKKIYKMRTHT